MVPDLIARMGGKDPMIKIHLIRLLQKFDSPEINAALEVEARRPEQDGARRRADCALATRGDSDVNIAAVAKLLQDPDLDVHEQGRGHDDPDQSSGHGQIPRPPH